MTQAVLPGSARLGLGLPPEIGVIPNIAERHDLLRALDELLGRDIVCLCAPLPCHGDLLLRPANASRDERIAWWRGVKVRA